MEDGLSASVSALTLQTIMMSPLMLTHAGRFAMSDDRIQIIRAACGDMTALAANMIAGKSSRVSALLTAIALGDLDPLPQAAAALAMHEHPPDTLRNVAQRALHSQDSRRHARRSARHQWSNPPA